MELLRRASWDVVAIAELHPGISDEAVAAMCSEEGRVLLTFDKDFGELLFRRGLEANSGTILFRVTPDTPEAAGRIALAVIESVPDLTGCFCVVTKDRIRIRPSPPGKR